MLLKHIYSDGNYLTGAIFLYIAVAYIAAYDSLWKSKEKVEPKETLKSLGNIIIWPVWVLVYVYLALKEWITGKRK